MISGALRGKLLHVLGAGPWQLPTIRRARELGVRVLATDMYEQRPGYALADHHEVADISDLALTLAVARRRGIHGILCDTTDTGVRTAAGVAAALGLPGIGVEAAHICTDKAALRDVCAAAGLPGPAYRVVEDTAAWREARALIGPALVVKPVDNQSGRGVSIVGADDDEDGGEAAFKAAKAYSHCGRVLCESQLRGNEFIVDGIVDGDDVRVLGIARKRPYADNPTVSSRILYPAGDEFDNLAALLSPIHRRVLRAAGLTRGVFHAEYIVDRERGPVVIDLAARGGGVMIYSQVVPTISGVNMIDASIHAALGLSPPAPAPAQRRAACIEFFRLPEGELLQWLGDDEARASPGVAALHLGLAAGEHATPLRKKDDRPGFIITVADGADQAVAAASAALARLHVRMAAASEPQSVLFDRAP